METKKSLGKLTIIGLVFVTAVAFSGCTQKNTSDSTQGTSNSGAVGGSKEEQKRGDTTKVGTITAAGGKYFLTEIGSSPKEIESYSVELSDYVGQNVTVTGQYSGDTLFVGKVE